MRAKESSVHSIKPAQYALYKGDELLDIGTVREIAGRRGVKPDTISYYARPAYQRKGSGNNRLLLVRIDEEG